MARRGGGLPAFRRSMTRFRPAPCLRPAGLALLLLAGAPARARDEATVEEALAYAWSDVIYTMSHEIGHMMVTQFDLPVLAREEDAVDNLAMLMVLEDFAETEDRILDDAAYGWWLSEAWGEEIGDGDLAGTHSLDQQRAYAMVCLMVGSDAEAFGPVADDWGLEPDRQEGCARDDEQARASWEAVLAPHRGEPAAPMIEVVYEEPEDGYEDIARFLRESEALETAAARVDGAFALPEPVTFRALDCGEDNACWDPGTFSVELCYEHAQGHFDLYLADLMAEEEEEEEGEGE